MDNLDAVELNVRQWCASYLATALKLPANRIDPQVKFARLGMDSAAAVFFLAALEDWLGVELASEVVFDHPSIWELARYVVHEFPQAATAAVGK